MVSALKDLSQHAPYGVALSASDHGIRKYVVVFPGHLVEDESRRRLGSDKWGHASTSVRVECILSRESWIWLRRVAARSDSAAGVPARRASWTSSLSSL